jgi:Domain of unknown function (DUF4824)
MNWRRVAASAALLVLTNVIVLVGVTYNRSDEPEAEITLTERELPLSYADYRSEENTGLALRLDWQHPGHRWHAIMFESQFEPNWFDQGKLENIGYDCSLPLSDPFAEQYYDRMLPREAYVVLAYGGEAWARWREEWDRDKVFMLDQIKKGKQSKEHLERFNEAYDRSLKIDSRLLAVDVGADPVELRQRYPDRRQFVIVRALTRLQLAREGKTSSGKHRPSHLRGDISHLLIDDIHVPFEQRAILDALLRSEAERRARPQRPYVKADDLKEPRYEVTLRFGKRYEPWITSIRPLEAKPQ